MPRKSNKKRKDGRIRSKVYLGTVDGQKKYKYVYGYKQSEVDEKVKEIRMQLGRGLDISAREDTFEQWADRLLKVKKSDVSAGEYANLISAKNALRQIWKYTIGRVTTADIQDIILDLAAENPHTHKPTAKRTLKKVRDFAAAVFAFAAENRALDYNPAQYVKIPDKAPQEKRRALTEEEQGWIINTPHRAQRVAMIMMFAGLRRGELIPLTKNDIDLQNNTITVNKAVEMIGGRASLKDSTKTPAGMRVVDIPQVLSDFLREDFAKDQSGSVLVCPAPRGGMMTSQAWRCMWINYIKTLNQKYGVPFGGEGEREIITIPPITSHWLRHTCATLMYLAGVDVKDASVQLGHADVKTTLDIYVHLDKQYKRRPMSKLDEYISARRQNVK